MQTTTAEPTWLMREDLSEFLAEHRGIRLSERAIRLADQRGEIGGAVIGRRRVFKPSDIDAWLERRHAASTVSA